MEPEESLSHVVYAIKKAYVNKPKKAKVNLCLIEI
ncbi:MAG: hypothetical protein K0S80_2535 [Neobacillus sp.]|nr:hypothetical protein [Neobacillus sp.]